jgi:tetratricopeptide (TPR) repeat protein
MQRDDVMHDFFYEAVEYYTAVLHATPVDDLVELAQVHNQLGVAYQYAVDGAEQAYEHFRQAVDYNDLAQETYEAVVTRMNAAQMLDRLERFRGGAYLRTGGYRDDREHRHEL